MPSKKKAQDLAARGGAEALDLNACFEGRDEGHRDRNWLESPYRFEKDPHWNELGNRLAAACLDELLRRQAGLPPLAEVARDAALAEYYAAFERPSPLGEISRESGSDANTRRLGASTPPMPRVACSLPRTSPSIPTTTTCTSTACDSSS